MYGELVNALRESKCPHCGTLGSLYILQAQAVIQCNHCHKTFIDPFEKGPAELEGVVSDSLDNEIVSLYDITQEETEETEFNETLAEFLNYYYTKHVGDDAFRVVEQVSEDT